METGVILSKDGLKLFFRSEKAKIPAANILLLHGFSEHSGRYHHVFQSLLESNYNVFAIDLRGHGYSQGERGYIDSFSQYISDVDVAVKYVKKHSNLPLILLGHSMGGLIATLYAAKYQHKLNGLILSSPLYGIALEVSWLKHTFAQIASRFFPGVSLPSGIVPGYLSHDAKKYKEHEEDPLIFNHVTARWFVEMLKRTFTLSKIAKKITLPVLFQLSGDDRIVSLEKSKVWFKKCVSKDKTQIVYPRMFHEIYNEIDRENILKDLNLWMQKRFFLKKKATPVKKKLVMRRSKNKSKSKLVEAAL